jgi:hypothetical protein
VHAISRIVPRSRRGKAIAAIGAGLATLAVAGTGVAAAGPVKPAAPPAGTQNVGAYVRVVGPTVFLAADGYDSSTVSCPAGLLALGGGESNSAPGNLVLTDSYPSSTTSWRVYVKSSAAVSQTFAAYVVCGV